MLPCPFFSAEAQSKGEMHGHTTFQRTSCSLRPAKMHRVLRQRCFTPPVKVTCHLLRGWRTCAGSSCGSSSSAVNPQPSIPVVTCSSNCAVAGIVVCTLDNIGSLRPSCFHICSACICVFRQVLKHLELKKYFSCTHKISYLHFDRVIEASKQPYNAMQ